MFAHNSHRDAYSTIRGYVYQVDTTLIRWMALSADNMLQLECGEDVDEVSRTISGQETRLAEQVKHRESSPSLNQVETLEILLRFVEHRERNPDYNMHFRYLTNAAPAVESPAFFETGEKGIEVWQELRKHGHTVDSFFTRLQEKLVTKLEPLAKKEGRWEPLADVIADAEKFKIFISAVDWSMGAPSAEAQGELVVKELEARYKSTREQAHLRYSRLFLYVFKLLSQPGLKELTTHALETEMMLPALGSADAALLQLLQSAIPALELRVVRVEARLDEQGTALCAVTNQLTEVTQITAKWQSGPALLSTVPPPLVANGSKRSEKVKELQQQLQAKSWLHLQGTYGTGKTQLAALLAHTHASAYWLELAAHKNDPHYSAVLLERFLAQVVFLSGSLIILNDIPVIRRNDTLYSTLFELIRTLAERNVQLMTTSNHLLPDEFTRHFPGFVPVQDFAFTDSEIEEFMSASGAPETSIKLLPIIASVSKRHAQLVAAVIYHLQGKQWNLSAAQAFLDLLNDSFRENLLQDAQEDIRRFVPEQDARELLYRLSLIHYGMLEPDIYRIAAVPAAVIHPRERLSVLRHTWLRVNQPYFEVSPVIHDIGKRNLPESTIRGVHGAMARQLLLRESINPLMATQAMTAFIAAGEPDHAGSVLLQAYIHAQSVEQAEALRQWRMLDFYSDMPFPEGMRVSMIGAILFQQIRLLEMLGKDAGASRRKLRVLTADLDLADAEAFSIHAQVIGSGAASPMDFLYHFNLLLSIWPHYQGGDEHPITAAMLSTSFWIPVEQLSTEEAVEEWLELADRLQDQLDVYVFADPFALTALGYLAHNLMTAGLESADAALRIISPLARYFRKRGLYAFEAVFFKEVVSLRYTELKDPEGALDSAEEKLEEWGPDHHLARYILLDDIARLLLSQGHRDAARGYVSLALAENAGESASLAATYLLAATLYATEDSRMGVTYMAIAREVAATEPDYPPITYTALLGESAIAYWLNGQHAESIAFFESALDRLLAVPKTEQNDYYKKIYLFTASAINYIGVTMGRDYVRGSVEGVKEGLRPFVGVISFSNQPQGLDTPSGFEPISYTHLSLYAEGTGDITTAYGLSSKGQDLARAGNHTYALHLTSSVFREHALIQFHPVKALESAVLHAAAHTHLQGTMEQKAEQLYHLNMRGMLASKPSPAWNEAEQIAVEQAVCPLLLIVLTARMKQLPDAHAMGEQLMQAAFEYGGQASDINLWSQAETVLSGILTGSRSEVQLRDMAGIYGEHGRRPLQILSLLGAMALSTDPATQVREMINLFPFFTNRFQYSRGIIRFVFVPFAQALLSSSGAAVDTIDVTGDHLLQRLLRPLAEHYQVPLVGNRDRWLFHLEEI